MNVYYNRACGETSILYVSDRGDNYNITSDRARAINKTRQIEKLCFE